MIFFFIAFEATKNEEKNRELKRQTEIMQESY